MALAGKELGKEVGSWFGPSTAAGAIRRLVGEFGECGLAVSVAMDGVVYQSEVYAASHSPVSGTHSGTTSQSHSVSGSTKTRHSAKKVSIPWGDRAVLVLIGIRLGIDGVNPIYYDSVKVCPNTAYPVYSTYLPDLNI